MTVDIGLYAQKLHSEMALELAELCHEVYKKRPNNNEPDIQAIKASLKLRGDAYSEIYGFAQNNTQAILAEHENFIAMVFRGTDEAADWIDNLDGRRANSEQAMFGEFHRGFYRCCNEVWDQIDEKYKELRAADRRAGRHRPLFLTGHSLGGAIATVAAARLMLEDRPFSGVYTYGQPRVVKRNTARVMSDEIGHKFFRFQNNQDIVTRIPTRFMGYGHVGQCLYIDDDGSIHTDPGFWYRFLDFFEGALEMVRDNVRTLASLATPDGGEGILSEGPIGDHNIRRYIDKIKSWDYHG